MRKLDSAIPVGHQRVTRFTKLYVRKCASKYRVFDCVFRVRKHFHTQSLSKRKRKRRERENWILMPLTISERLVV
jgi:hypothetical protein